MTEVSIAYRLMQQWQISSRHTHSLDISGPLQLDTAHGGLCPCDVIINIAL